MSDEVKATGYDCCDRVGGESDWLWIIIIFIVFWFLCGDNNWFGGRGGCR